MTIQNKINYGSWNVSYISYTIIPTAVWYHYEITEHELNRLEREGINAR